MRSIRKRWNNWWWSWSVSFCLVISSIQLSLRTINIKGFCLKFSFTIEIRLFALVTIDFTLITTNFFWIKIADFLYHRQNKKYGTFGYYQSIYNNRTQIVHFNLCITYQQITERNVKRNKMISNLKPFRFFIIVLNASKRSVSIENRKKNWNFMSWSIESTCYFLVCLSGCLSCIVTLYPVSM